MMHDMAVGNGWVTPSEFWQLSPGEFWWLYRAKVPDAEKPVISEMSEIRRMVKAEKAKEKASAAISRKAGGSNG